MSENVNAPKEFTPELQARMEQLEQLERDVLRYGMNLAGAPVELKTRLEQLEQLERDVLRHGMDFADALSGAREQGAQKVFDGTHEVFLHEAGNPAFPGNIEDELADKPFARFSRYSDRGDASVGLQGYDAWYLQESQEGTGLAALIERVKLGEAALQLLLESADSIGGDWRQRRDALLRQGGLLNDEPAKG